MELPPSGVGWIEVICGSMFSGKSEELIRRLRRAEIAKQRVQAFKAATDDRYDQVQIVSHSDVRLHSIPVSSAQQLEALVDPDVQIVGIDEAQFLGAEIVDVCEWLADRGVRVIVAGLDQDYRGRPFEPVPTLMAVAEYVTKVHAICVKCGNPANRSQRVVDSEERVVVGAAGTYEARCRRCFTGAPAHEGKEAEATAEIAAPAGADA